MPEAVSPRVTGDGSPGGGVVRGPRWLSGRALLLHLAVVVWVPGCAAAAWWQVTVATSGNGLGWLYAVEWPVFAVLGVIGWWQLVHDDPETVRARRAPRGRRPRAAASVGGLDVAAIHEAEEHDRDLAAYNAYLARLASSGSAKTWRDPTGGAPR